jgi:fluoride ion exporter CrcB/FEX
MNKKKASICIFSAIMLTNRSALAHPSPEFYTSIGWGFIGGITTGVISYAVIVMQTAKIKKISLIEKMIIWVMAMPIAAIIACLAGAVIYILFALASDL